MRTTPAGSNYFETFQQPLVAGRLFTASEIDEGRNVAIVDETFVRLVLGGKSAIGQLVRQSPTERSDEPGPWLEIVGVVKDVTLAPDKTTADAKLYRPAAPDGMEHLRALPQQRRLSQAQSRCERDGSPASSDPELRRSNGMRKTTRRWPASPLRRSGRSRPLTLMLAAAGIHSLISFTLASRTREIGIRTALGAAPLRIVRGILSPAFMKVGVGIVLGSIPGTVLISATLNLGINSRMTVVATACVAVFIIAVAMISCVWPVRRALKIQPTEALRTT